MKTFYLAFNLFAFFYCVSCSQDSHKEIQHESDPKEDALVKKTDLDEILQINENANLNFENLLTAGNDVETSDVSGVADYSEKLLTNIKEDDIQIAKISPKDLEAETAFKNLEVNSLEHKKSIEDLRLINQKKTKLLHRFRS